jgi:hypothetical protein
MSAIIGKANAGVLHALLVCLISGVAAKANTMSYVTANGANILGSNVNDRITFITSLNQIEIQVQNLQTGISREIQAISAIDFLIGGVLNVQPTSINLKTSLVADPNLGQVITITDSTTYTTAALTTITNRWNVSTTGQQLAGGTQISVFGGGRGSPTQLIIGPPAYGAVNAAVTGHNPFLETDAGTHISFVLTYAPSANITAFTNIDTDSGQLPRLSFGTTFATTQELDLIPEVPEPTTVAIFLGGFALICLGCLRQSRPNQSAGSKPPEV